MLLPGVIRAAARPGRLDPGWPPVLIVFVLGVVGALMLLVVMFWRSVRADARQRARPHVPNSGGTR